MARHAVSEAKKQGANQDQYPIASSDVRALTLEAAGYDPELAGRMFRKAVEKLENKLEATKIQYFSFGGTVTDERVVEDSDTQVKSAKSLADIAMEVMALKQKSAPTAKTPTEINIDISGWTVQPTPSTEPKDVTP